MRTKNIFQKQMTRSFLNLWVSGLLLLVLLGSCGKDEEYKVELADELKVTTSGENIVLQQKFDQQNGLTVRWTTGSNKGTGAAISYLLQMDKAGNNFATPQNFNLGKAVYEKSLSVAELNQRLNEDFGVEPGESVALEVRVIATVLTTPETTQITEIKTVTIASYVPVSTSLFIIGSASPNGWSADDAIALEPRANSPGVFEFKGALGAGEFKFITTRGQFLPSYNKGANSTSLVYRTDDAQPDDKFEIVEGAVYKIVADLLDLTISVTKYDLPVYDALYIVGSASPNGWDITNSIQLEQDEGNPFLFRYIGVLHAGEFKFPVNRNGDWGQDMFMRET
ncbi:MAG: SusF/SusE family outer membrane protein, partial [Bacteroidales bacterium]|nr:SusF/SusE family outer membrane protein [Bacteroidales bacterium]